MTTSRGGVLTGEHPGSLREVFASVCAGFGAELVELDGADDHLHLLVANLPQGAVARLVNPQGRLGSAAAPAIAGAHPPGAAVSPSSFAASAGGAPLETPRVYIRQQRTPGRPG